MKTRFKNITKFALIAIFMLSVGVVSAQQTTGDVGKSADGPAAGTTGYIKVIDNKGTKKYLQAKNGVTILTDATPDGGIISTWQLGGVLTDDTTIDASGAVFAITGVKAIDPVANPVSDIAATTYDSTGYTLMVRDEATGETKKMLATDLIQSGHTKTDGSSLTIDLGINLPSFEQVWVYRNGAKLIADTDYSIATSVVTLSPQANGDDEDWALYSTDVIEVHFVK